MDNKNSCPINCQCDNIVKCLINQFPQPIICPFQWKTTSLKIYFNISDDINLGRLFYNCSESGITAIMLNMGKTKKLSSSFLLDIPYLEKLIIIGPGILEKLDDYLFQHTIYLKTFKVIGNKLWAISKNLLNPCLNIQQLYLSNNQLGIISNSSFKNCQNIKILDLSYNNLTVIYKKTFYGLLGLLKLLLSNNKISFIETQAFSYLRSIHTIDLSHNQLLSIEIGTFFHIPNLVDLLLNDNKIGSLSIHAFKNVRKLKYLNLKNNNLYWLNELIFEDMNNLEKLELDLSINCIMKKEKIDNLKKIQIHLRRFPSCVKEENVINTLTTELSTDKTTRKVFVSFPSTYLSQSLKGIINNKIIYSSTKVFDSLSNKTCFNCTVSVSCATTHIWISFLAGVMTLACFVLVFAFAIYVLITQRIIHNLRRYKSNQDALSMVTTNTRESNLFPPSKCDYKSINGHIDCDVAV